MKIYKSWFSFKEEYFIEMYREANKVYGFVIHIDWLNYPHVGYTTWLTKRSYYEQVLDNNFKVIGHLDINEIVNGAKKGAKKHEGFIFV